jgi:hypothetical protein
VVPELVERDGLQIRMTQVTTGVRIPPTPPLTGKEMKKLKSALKSQFLPSLFTIPLLAVCAFLFGQMDMLAMSIAVMWPVVWLIMALDKLWNWFSDSLDLQPD